jgi:hypothetical protein
MKYPYYEMSEAQYQNLVNCICKKVLGTTTQTYSPGKDDGKDASFVGTAAEIPNHSHPWTGTFIVQAKHTNRPFAKFSDNQFYSENSQSTVLAKELPKIKKLHEKNELDYYLLFSNRNLSGTVDTKIKQYIFQNTGVPVNNILLFGNDDTERLLKQFPEIVRCAEIDPVNFPLTADPSELAEVILKMVDQQSKIIYDAESSIPPRTPMSEKIKLNNMTQDYAALIINEIGNFDPIQQFLQNDDESRNYYESVVTELNAKIVAKRQDYQSFDEIIEYIYDLFISRDQDLKKHNKTLRQLLYFMFWFCDIGKNLKC